MSKKSDLYRYFDKNGVLLYVGISASAFSRFAQHNQNSQWINDSATMTIEKFDNLYDARVAEMNAIKSEKPKFNINHNNNQKGVVNVKIWDKSYKVNVDEQNPLLELATDVNARQKVWDFMVRNMTKGNVVTTNQTNLSKDLFISRQHILRVFKELEERQFIVKFDKSKSNNIYMLNPMKVWNGSAEDHARANAKFCELRDKRKPKTESTTNDSEEQAVTNTYN